LLPAAKSPASADRIQELKCNKLKLIFFLIYLLSAAAIAGRTALCSHILLAHFLNQNAEKI
jgi:hypothetical protein